MVEDWRQAVGRWRAAYMPPLRSDGNGQAEGSRPLPTMWGDRGTKRKRTLTQGCGPGMPGPYRGGGRLAGAGRERRGRDESLPYGLCEREIVGRPALRPPRACMGVGMISDHTCRGRRPRRPAEGSRPLPTMRKIRGWLWKVRGPGMPGPYGGEKRRPGQASTSGVPPHAIFTQVLHVSP